MFSLGAAALALALAGCGGGDGDNARRASANNAAPLTQIAAPNNGDWTQMVDRDAEGGFLMGNPERAGEAGRICLDHLPALRRVRRGRRPSRCANTMSAAARSAGNIGPIMIFPTDPGIFALLRCQGPTPFFQLAEQLYASQRDWIGAAAEHYRRERAPAARRRMPPTRRRRGFWSAATGLDQFFRQRGMPEARIDSCLADQRAICSGSPTITRARRPEDSVTGHADLPASTASKPRAPAPGPQLEPLLRAAIGG